MQRPQASASRSVAFELDSDAWSPAVSSGYQTDSLAERSCLDESSQFHLSLEDVSTPPGTFRPVSPAPSVPNNEMQTAAVGSVDENTIAPEQSRLRSHSVPIFHDMSPEDRISWVAVELRTIGDEITRRREIRVAAGCRQRLSSVSGSSVHSETIVARRRSHSVRDPAVRGGEVVEVGEAVAAGSWPGSSVGEFMARMFRTLSGADIDRQDADEAAAGE